VSLIIYASVLAALNMSCSSRSWVEEEGEIFRKGAVLLSREQMEGDFAGEELRREVRSPLAVVNKEVTQRPTALGGHG
jgi:hypothetical protein